MQPEQVHRLTHEPIDIVPYDPHWPHLFDLEKAHLLQCLPSNLIRRIEHFGSTAVPGLAAKPVIDILIEVTSLDAARENIVPILQAQGYEYLWRPTIGDDGEPFYCWFIKRNAQGHRTHHLHCVEAHFTEHWDRLLFRDYLIAHPETAILYEALKMQLAASIPIDRAAYTRAKTDFIQQITTLAKAQFNPASPEAATSSPSSSQTPP